MHALAQSAGLWALPAVILTSALGALLMCLLVFRYGFPGADEAPPSAAEASRRLLLTRFGHAAAGVCFAISAILGLVALVERARATTPAEGLRSELATLRDRLAGLEARLGPVESRLGAVASRAGGAERRAVAAEARAGSVLARLDRVESRLEGVEASLRRARADTGHAEGGRVGPAASPPRDARPAAARLTRSGAGASPTRPGLGDKLRDDWQTIKREGRATRSQVGRAFRKLWESFSP
jgi:hypothetical protein